MIQNWCPNQRDWIRYEGFDLRDYAIEKCKDCKDCEFYKIGCKYPQVIDKRPKF